MREVSQACALVNLNSFVCHHEQPINKCGSSTLRQQRTGPQFVRNNSKSLVFWLVNLFEVELFVSPGFKQGRRVPLFYLFNLLSWCVLCCLQKLGVKGGNHCKIERFSHDDFDTVELKGLLSQLFHPYCNFLSSFRNSYNHCWHNPKTVELFVQDLESANCKFVAIL